MAESACALESVVWLGCAGEAIQCPGECPAQLSDEGGDEFAFHGVHVVLGESGFFTVFLIKILIAGLREKNSFHSLPRY